MQAIRIYYDSTIPLLGCGSTELYTIDQEIVHCYCAVNASLENKLFIGSAMKITYSEIFQNEIS